jgi:predicted phage tail protein
MKTFTEKFEDSIKSMNDLPKNVEVKALVGASAAGLVAPVGVVTTVAAFGTASTGTAISTLSGAAATNATFAAIGGGSLATGGGGMILGATILTGGSILIALGVGYGIWKFLTTKNNNKAIDQNGKNQVIIIQPTDWISANRRHRINKL